MHQGCADCWLICHVRSPNYCLFVDKTIELEKEFLNRDNWRFILTLPGEKAGKLEKTLWWPKDFFLPASETDWLWRWIQINSLNMTCLNGIILGSIPFLYAHKHVLCCSFSELSIKRKAMLEQGLTFSDLGKMKVTLCSHFWIFLFLIHWNNYSRTFYPCENMFPMVLSK